MLSVALFIKSGNEQELLSKANFNSLTKDMAIRKALALKNPYLEKKLRVTDVDISNIEPYGDIIIDNIQQGNISIPANCYV